MILFLLVAAAMTCAALAWALPPLLGRRSGAGDVERAGANLAVLRDQLAELDRDLEQGTLDPEQHARARAELERRVLEEAAPGADPPARSRSGRPAAAVVGALIPVSALVLYVALGNPAALAPRDPAHGGPAITAEQVEQMVKRLSARLEANPDDPPGWALLGRSYFVMGRFEEAARAYEKAAQTITDDADLLADYADALAMSRGRSFDAKTRAILDRALAVDPDHPKALALAGTAAFEAEDYPAAIAHFERMEKLLPPGSDLARLVTERLAEARKLAGVAAPAAKSEAASVAGRVSLSPALAGRAGPEDTVFILARAPDGPRTPLAVIRRQVKDLPLDFALGDEQAMSPALKVSKFREVVLVARVSKSGSAMPQSGDLQGTTPPVKVGAGGVTLLIDSVVP